MSLPWKRTFCTLAWATAVTLALAQNYTLTILHTNDLHSHGDAVKVSGKSVGGYARQASAILQARETSKNPILLNAGDTFQGTMYFNVYEGLSDLSFMNLMGYDAMCAGNHEFDRGPQVFANFIKLARFPVLAANLDCTKEPALDGLIPESTVLEVAGEKIGIVGAITPDLPNISSPGDNIKMLDYVRSVQKAVDALTAQKIDKVILLCHTGYTEDLEFAKKLRNIDVVVGGHSHTLCGKVEIPNATLPDNPYPTVTNDAAGKPVLIVQAWEWGKVLGKIVVDFDDKGVVVSHSGGPVLIDETWPENPHVKALMEAFNKPLAAARAKVVAKLETDLSQRWSSESGDSLMGNVIADSAYEATIPQGSVAAFWNVGGVRSGLTAGTVTYGQLIEVCPFGNTLVVLELTGQELIDAIEHGVSESGMLIPSANCTYTFNPAAEKGKRVVQVKIKGQPVDPKATYKVTVNNFVANGGDSHTVLKNAKGARLDTGFVDLDALIAFFERHNPVSASKENRISTTPGQTAKKAS